LITLKIGSKHISMERIGLRKEAKSTNESKHHPPKKNTEDSISLDTKSHDR